LLVKSVITDDRSCLLSGQVLESWITSACGQTASTQDRPYCYNRQAYLIVTTRRHRKAR